jgi:hypothetical protein
MQKIQNASTNWSQHELSLAWFVSSLHDNGFVSKNYGVRAAKRTHQRTQQIKICITLF